MHATTDCPPGESWLRMLREDLSLEELEVLEDHLGRCESCVRTLAELAGGWSLAGLADPKESLDFGAGTLKMLARVAAVGPVRPDLPAATLESVTPPEIPGLGDWEVVGRGGMGVVFRAREVALDRLVAVKVLSAAARLAPSARARAIREALLMASLRHPNVVQVYRSGEAGGLPFLVMEWVDGGTLQDRIGTRLASPREAAETARDLANAVAEAHALGIVHRDLKPANVLLASSAGGGTRPIPKLTDFGLARRGDDDGVTETGAVLGTPGYMAPEQTGLARSLGEAGPATDIHGLGAILHASLTGQAPYAGRSSWEVLIRTARGGPQPVRELRRDVPRDLATIIEKCLQTSPSRRYRSAGELADDLGRFLGNRPISARPTSTPERWLKWARRHPGLAASLALLAFASIGAIAGTAYHLASITRSLEKLAAEQARTGDALASATSARDRARRTLASLTDDVVQRLVERGAALNDADRRFLDKVRGFYLEWPLAPDPGASLEFRGAGLARLGVIFEQIDQYEAAKVCREAAIDAYEDAIRRGHDGAEVVAAKIKAMVLLHQVLGKARQHVAAEAVARKLIETHEILVRSDESHRRNLALDYTRLGEDLAMQGRDVESDASFREGICRSEQLRIEMPADPTILEAEMRAYYMAADRAKDKGRAESLFRELLARTEMALGVIPGHRKFFRYQTWGLSELAKLIKEARPDEAWAVHRRRMEITRKLVELDPEDKSYRGDLVVGAAEGYEICRLRDRAADAEAELGRGIEEGGRLIAAEPAVFDRALALILALEAHASLLISSGRARQAIDPLDRVAETCAPWAKLQGRSDEVVPRLVAACRRSAQIHSTLGDHPGAARRLARALDLTGPEQRAMLELAMARELLAGGDRPGAGAAARRAAVDPKAAAEAAELLDRLGPPAGP